MKIILKQCIFKGIFFIWLSIIIAVINIIVDKSDKQFQTFPLDYFYSFRQSLLLLLCMPLVLQCHPHFQHQIYDQQSSQLSTLVSYFSLSVFDTWFFSFSTFNLILSIAYLSFSSISTTDICCCSNIVCVSSSYFFLSFLRHWAQVDIFQIVFEIHITVLK